MAQYFSNTLGTLIIYWRGGGGVGAVGIFSLCPDKTYLIPHKTEIFEWSTSLAVNILAGDDSSSLVPPENHVFPQNTISPHSPSPSQGDN